MENVIIEFREMTFEGLRFKSSKKYPDSYFENLLKEDTHYNRVKYRDAVGEQLSESVHIKLSYAFAIKVISIITMAISLILGLQHFFIGAMIMLGVSFGFHLFHSYLKNVANEIFMGIEMCKDLVDIIFENK
jgi:hypothetical protein